MVKYAVWGAGHRGRILYELLGADRIAAFIDSNPAKTGTTYLNCPVIDYETYKKEYRRYVIIVSIVFGGGVTELLERDRIFYFNVEQCPPEFMGYGLNTARHALKEWDLKIPDNAVLYGGTLYTVLVYEELQKRGRRNLSVCLPSSMEEKMRSLFSEMMPEIRTIQSKEIDSQTILLTEKTRGLEPELSGCPVLDIADWTQYVPAYHNHKIEALKNRFRGRRCFIVATGPSLTYADLSRLHDNHEFCMSINSIFTCFPETPWRPDCYTVLDADGITMWQGEFHKLKDIPCKFIADCQPYFDYTQLDESWHVYHSILDDFSIKHMLFSEDCSRKVYNGSTVVYVCIQFAAYLGFKEIYLLGVDYSYRKNGKNHFTKQVEPDEQFDGMNGQDRIQRISYEAFRRAGEYASSHGIKIYNASRKTCLDVFEQVDFDTLFPCAGEGEHI